ncbi:hypothetical protein [Nannocystis exedens]|nr:hypothetical protein [Nannocystis exedens]
MLEREPAGAWIRLARASIVHPHMEGAVRSLGWPRGQIADWRFPPTPGCRGLHVHEYADRWEAHVDRVHPACDPLGHLQHDAPQILIGGGALVGGLLGLLLVRRQGRGLAMGTTAGALVRLALVSARSSRT